MATALPTASGPVGFVRIYTWPRARTVLLVGFIASVILLPGWKGVWIEMLARLYILGFLQLLVFGVLEAWPRRLPGWLARWVLQIVGVAMSAPFAMAIAYWLTTLGDPGPWYQDKDRLGGYSMLAGLSILFTPWIAMTALYRHVSGQAQRQALAFELERSELERNATAARLSLLQAQVEPHFLFNTLANVRELVDSGSPQASVVLGNLINYLRAAVPRLQESATTLGQEFELVRAYLEVMHMRMPDRLQFVLHADEAALAADCPSMAVLTLVENAVRHGIDPSEEGGRIEVRARLLEGRLRIEVVDTGVGVRPGSGGLGTGLANLRERLQLAYGARAQLRLAPVQPRGTSAEIEFPAHRGTA